MEIGLKPIQTADGRFVLATVVDVSERRRMQDAQRSAIEGQLEFERFVAELSFQFINLPANEVIDVIRAVSVESVRRPISTGPFF